MRGGEVCVGLKGGSRYSVGMDGRVSWMRHWDSTQCGMGLGGLGWAGVWERGGRGWERRAGFVSGVEVWARLVWVGGVALSCGSDGCFLTRKLKTRVS